MGWDRADFAAAEIQRLARKCLLPSAVQYGIEPKALQELMRDLWAQYAKVKVEQGVRKPSGLMYIMMRKAALRIPELRQPEKDKTWSQIWQAGNVTNER